MIPKLNSLLSNFKESTLLFNKKGLNINISFLNRNENEYQVIFMKSIIYLVFFNLDGIADSSSIEDPLFSFD